MSKADILLKKAASFEKLAAFSDRKAFFASLAQDNKYTGQNMSFDPLQSINPMHDQEYSGNPPTAGSKPTFAPIDQKAQEALSRVNSIEGIGIPISVDGKFGPETKSALQAFKQKFNCTNMSDKDALDVVLMTAKDPKYQTSETGFQFLNR